MPIHIGTDWKWNDLKVVCSIFVQGFLKIDFRRILSGQFTSWNALREKQKKVNKNIYMHSFTWCELETQGRRIWGEGGRETWQKGWICDLTDLP